MSRLLRQGLLPAMVGLGVSFSLAYPSQGQFFSPEIQQETVIMIGGSPEEWSYYSGYWQQLLDLNPQPIEENPEEVSVEPRRNLQQDQAYLKELSENLVVQDLRQQKISKRFGTSQVVGTLTNYNQEPVVVLGINFEIRTSTGKLLQTGSAVPEPNLLAPGQTVTFSETLLSIPINRRFQLQLLDPAVTLRPQGLVGEALSQ